MTAITLSQALADEYDLIFASAKIRSEHLAEVRTAAERIVSPANWTRYQDVGGKTGIPPHVIGIIHSLEASGRFDRHLHNGDPLTARTVRVPSGHPTSGKPPFTWEESAADALAKVRSKGWSIAEIAFALEAYNGWGYRRFHPQVKSPYLWSFTTAYTSGKYVADGKWSDTAVSRQCGAMAILRYLIDHGRISLTAPAAPGTDEPPVQPFANIIVVNAPAYPGHMFGRGSSGSDVRRIQEKLILLGIGAVGGVDGDFGEKTEWAAKLFQARHEDGGGEPLDIDGVVGPKTWGSLFDEDQTTSTSPAAPATPGVLLDAVLDVARSQLGVREMPRGSNRGPEVDAYLSSVSASLLGQPWCMAFVYWCFAKAAANIGVANPAPRTASVWRSWEMVHEAGTANIVSAAEARRDADKVLPGMVFYIDTGGRSGHTGFVTGFADGKLVTLEGNTNNDGSREGYGVFTRNRRRVDSINLGFVDFS